MTSFCWVPEWDRWAHPGRGSPGQLLSLPGWPCGWRQASTSTLQGADPNKKEERAGQVTIGYVTPPPWVVSEGVETIQGPNSDGTPSSWKYVGEEKESSLSKVALHCRFSTYSDLNSLNHAKHLSGAIPMCQHECKTMCVECCIQDNFLWWVEEVQRQFRDTHRGGNRSLLTYPPKLALGLFQWLSSFSSCKLAYRFQTRSCPKDHAT